MRLKGTLISFLIFILPLSNSFGLELISMTKESGQPAQAENHSTLNEDKIHEFRVTFSDGIASLPPPSAIISGMVYKYIVDAKGNLLIANPTEVRSHFYLSGGQPVAGAGEIIFQDGKIAYIDNESDQYRPGEVHLNQVVQLIQKERALAEGFTFHFIQLVESTTQKEETPDERYLANSSENESCDLPPPIKFYPNFPHKLHFIWIGSGLPEKYRANLNTWISLNKDYEFNLWYDPHYISENEMEKMCQTPISCRNVSELLNENPILQDHYNYLLNKTKDLFKPHWAMAADLIRLLAIIKEGGWYADLDSQCKACLPRISPLKATSDRDKVFAMNPLFLKFLDRQYSLRNINPNVGLTCNDSDYLPKFKRDNREAGVPVINNCFIGARPNNAALQMALDKMNANLQDLKRSRFLRAFLNPKLTRVDSGVYAFTFLPLTYAIHQAVENEKLEKTLVLQNRSDRTKVAREYYQPFASFSAHDKIRHNGDGSWSNTLKGKDFAFTILDRFQKFLKTYEIQHKVTDKVGPELQDLIKRTKKCDQKAPPGLCLINITKLLLSRLDDNLNDQSKDQELTHFFTEILEFLDKAVPTNIEE